MRWKTIFAACGLLFAAWPVQAASMKFQVIEVGCPKACAKVLLGEGEIGLHTDRSFRSALRRAGRRMPVILHSPGGNLAGGLKLGIAFREAGSSVSVAPGGGCFSACAYALFGGVNRKVLSGGQLGVHEFVDINRDPRRKLTAREKQENKEIAKLLNLYAEAMGVSPEVVGIALATRHDDIKILSRRQLKRLRVVTEG